MQNKIIVVDFGGTFVLPKYLDEANKFRSLIIKRSLPSKKEHAHSETLYKNNRAFVEQLTGVLASMDIAYTTNTKQTIRLKGESVQNQIATNLFQIGMYMTAKKFKTKMFHTELLKQLANARKKGYKLAIISGIRTDIISGVLTISKYPLQFDYILGQPPILGITNEEHNKALQKLGTVTYVIGDKMSDLEACTNTHAKTIFVTWGTPTGGEEEYANFTIKNAKDLEKIL